MVRTGDDDDDDEIEGFQDLFFFTVKKNCARQGNFSFFFFLFSFFLFLSRSKKKGEGEKVGCRCYPAIMRVDLSPKVTV